MVHGIFWQHPTEFNAINPLFQVEFNFRHFMHLKGEGLWKILVEFEKKLTRLLKDLIFFYLEAGGL